jgi:hypothetical protein
MEGSSAFYLFLYLIHRGWTNEGHNGGQHLVLDTTRYYSILLGTTRYYSILLPPPPYRARDPEKVGAQFTQFTLSQIKTQLPINGHRSLVLEIEHLAALLDSKYAATSDRYSRLEEEAQILQALLKSLEQLAAKI